MIKTILVIIFFKTINLYAWYADTLIYSDFQWIDANHILYVENSEQGGTGETYSRPFIINIKSKVVQPLTYKFNGFALSNTPREVLFYTNHSIVSYNFSSMNLLPETIYNQFSFKPNALSKLISGLDGDIYFNFNTDDGLYKVRYNRTKKKIISKLKVKRDKNRLTGFEMSGSYINSRDFYKKDLYLIQLYSLSSRSRALQASDGLWKKYKLESFILESDKKSETTEYAVFSGVYRNRTEALKSLKVIKTIGVKDAYLKKQGFFTFSEKERVFFVEDNMIILNRDFTYPEVARTGEIIPVAKNENNYIIQSGGVIYLFNETDSSYKQLNLESPETESALLDPFYDKVTGKVILTLGSAEERTIWQINPDSTNPKKVHVNSQLMQRYLRNNNQYKFNKLMTLRDNHYTRTLDDPDLEDLKIVVPGPGKIKLVVEFSRGPHFTNTLHLREGKREYELFTSID